MRLGNLTAVFALNLRHPCLCVRVIFFSVSILFLLWGALFFFFFSLKKIFIKLNQQGKKLLTWWTVYTSQDDRSKLTRSVCFLLVGIMNFKQLGKAVEVAKQASPAGSEWVGKPGEPGAEPEVCPGQGLRRSVGWEPLPHQVIYASLFSTCPFSVACSA